MPPQNSPSAGERLSPRPFLSFRRQSVTPLSPFRPFNLWKGKYFSPLSGILVGLILFLVSTTHMASVFEWRTLDMRFQRRGGRPIKSDLAIVFIGDDSIRAFGRWPWTWEHHALLVDVLKRHGVREVVFDIVFAERPEGSIPDIFPMALRSAGNVLLSSFFLGLDRNPVPGLPEIGSELTEPVPELLAAANGVGHCNAEPDADGITRRVPLLVRYSDGYYPSTPLLAVLQRYGIPVKSVGIEPANAITVPLADGPALRIPIDANGRTLVNFTGNLADFEQYSYLQVLQSDQFPDQAPLDLEKLRGKTVLVGVTFAGNTDIRPTPLSSTFPLTCVLGNVIDNIMQREFIRRASLFSRILTAVLLGATVAFLTYILRPFYSLSACVLLVAGWLGFSVFCFSRHLIWVDVISPLSIIVANYLVMTTVHYVQSRREKMQYLEYLKYMDELVESTNDAIVSFDLEHRVATWNKGALNIFGWTEREALGKGWDFLVAGATLDSVNSAVASVYRSGEPQSFEVTGLRRGRTEFPAGMSFSPVKDSHGTIVGVSCITQDLTEKKKMVEMLIQSEKMAELGRLGSGIVHEIKNPLTSIMLLSGMILNMEVLDPKARKYMVIIDQEAQRILRLSQNILSFARPKKAEMKVIELNKIVEEILSLTEYELRKRKVVPELRLREGGVPAVGDDEKMKQVFLNLVINAVHAMEGGGQLEISTDVAGEGAWSPPAGYATYSLGNPVEGRRAVIMIRDQGSGIRPEILEKIFDPFFTTKEEGKGTGLGLYLTRKIILEHLGQLVVSTKVDSGTIFRIVLPADAPPATAPDDKAASPPDVDSREM